NVQLTDGKCSSVFGGLIDRDFGRNRNSGWPCSRHLSVTLLVVSKTNCSAERQTSAKSQGNFNTQSLYCFSVQRIDGTDLCCSRNLQSASGSSKQICWF